MRTVHTLPADWLSARPLWAGLNSLVRVLSERHVGASVSRETRYYLSTLPPEAVERAAHGIRAHWSIENNLHWSLDIAFNEDQQRMRTGNAAANMALLSKIALNLLKQAPSKVGLKARRKRAGWDNRFLLTVLGKAQSI